MSQIQSPKGTYDILPVTMVREPWHSAQAWQALEQLLHEQSRRWGFEQLRLPIFESTQLYHKTTGDSSDIVQKEMYTFEDKGERSITLRPEGTPGALRALIEANAFVGNPIQKVYYLGPMFRYERPQQGRYRQFHQYGVELLGPRVAALDADVICLGWSILQALGLGQARLKINTLANESTRKLFKAKLKEYFSDFRSQLSPESERRLELNPLRILDSKDPGDQELLQGAPTLQSCIDEESEQFFQQVLHLLQGAGVSYQIDQKLVRGIDYYCDTVFEFQLPAAGAQASIGGGGRYGQLLASLGGPSLEGVGFAFGMERLLQAALAAGRLQADACPADLLLVALDEPCLDRCFTLAQQLRGEGLQVQLWPLAEAKRLKNALSYGEKIGARFVAILGEQELRTGHLQLRHMGLRQQELLEIAQLSQFLKINL